jgi:uncharacterized protein YndB with AHSA1/START domain
MTATMTELSMTTRRTIAAPARRIYEAWLDPKMLARFMIAKDGATVPQAKADPRVGGRFLVMMRQAGQDLPHQGEYLELVPYEKIVFTWESEHSDADSTVTVALTPVAGGTEVALTHVKFRSEAMRDGHMAGWTRILQQLQAEMG